MQDFQTRTRRLIGDEAVANLNNKSVAIFGLGGVGSFAAEAIARAGVGTLILCDFDTVDSSNINRQLYALHSTIGENKVDIARKRIQDINPQAKIISHNIFVKDENISLFDEYTLDACIDCIDSVESKVSLLSYFYKRKVYTVSAMGAARKIDPFKITHSDISKSFMCPLAKIIRKKLKAESIYSGIEVVFSTEESASHKPEEGPLGSISYLPSSVGLMAASLAIRSLISQE